MRSTQIVWLVARREMVARLRDKGFVISTVFILAVILGSVLLPAMFGDGSASYDVGIVGRAAQLRPVLQAQADATSTEVAVSSYSSVGEARAAVAAEDVEAAIAGQQVYVRAEIDGQLEALLNGAVAAGNVQRRLTAAGLDPEEVSRALDVPPLRVVALEADAERTAQQQAVAFAGVAVLYGLLIMIGQYVAIGVVEEKSSRVVELLLATIKPWQLLAGKVVGLGILGLAQLLLICLTGLGAAIGFDVLTVPGDAYGTIVSLIFWFLLGYAFFAAAFAAGAALVSRQEDLQSVLLPMIMLLIGALVAAIQAGESPDGVLARVTSVVPPLSPMVMPIRAAATAVPWWETAVAVLLMLAAVAGMVRLGGRIYAGALLRTGGKVKVREALASARA